MKLIITEQQFKQLININELRSNPDKNVDPSFNEFFDNLMSKFNIDDIFVSFRNSMNVTDVNPNNQYNTPTGFYSYPLKSYKADINELKFKNTFNEETFRSLFPFQSELKFINFFILNSNNGVLDDNTNKETLNVYAERIKQLYISKANDYNNLLSEKEKINNQYEQIENKDRTTIDNFKKQYNIINDKLQHSSDAGYVCEYCNQFIDDNFNLYNEYKPTHDTHKFWLLLYGVATKLTGSWANETNKRVTTLINIICQRIGVNGFVDYNGDGYIHKNEKKQAVFFKIKNIGKLFVYTKPKSKDLMSLDDSISNIINKYQTLYNKDSSRLYMLKKIVESNNEDLITRLFYYVGYKTLLSDLNKLKDVRLFKMLPSGVIYRIEEYAEIQFDRLSYNLNPMLTRIKRPLTNFEVSNIYNALNDNHEIDDNYNVIDDNAALLTIKYLFVVNAYQYNVLPEFLLSLKYIDYNKYKELMGEFAQLYGENNRLMPDKLNIILTNFKKQIKTNNENNNN